jgi:hypothetical protein
MGFLRLDRVSPDQRRPKRFEGAAINLPRGFKVDCRQFRMIQVRGETLLRPGVFRRRNRAANVTPNDSRV